MLRSYSSLSTLGDLEATDVSCLLGATNGQVRDAAVIGAPGEAVLENAALGVDGGLQVVNVLVADELGLIVAEEGLLMAPDALICMCQKAAGIL